MTNILIFSPHPDDAELCIGGIIAKHSLKYRIVIVDLTRGENSTNGTVSIRETESQQAADVLKICNRVNLNIPDSCIDSNSELQEKLVIQAIRKYRPSIILAPYKDDLHPDHKAAFHLINKAMYKSGLNVYRELGELHNCSAAYYYSQRLCKKGNSFFMDISEEYDIKMKALKCYRSQFSIEEANYSTYLNQHLINSIKAKDVYIGTLIGSEFGEEIIYEGNLLMDNLFGFVKVP